jgi:NADPH2:quinone reductase
VIWLSGPVPVLPHAVAIAPQVGGPYIAQNLALLRPRGRHVSIAFLQGSKVGEFDFGRLLVKRLTMTGSTLRPRALEEKAAIARELLHEVWPALDAGDLRPVMHSILPFDECAQSHALMESSEHVGKIVLAVGPSET